jgi:hypothetical protein
MAIKTLQKNNSGGTYYPANTTQKHGIQPGDIIELDGDYTFINLDSVIGTPEAPVIFRPKAGGHNRVGTDNSYAWIMTNSRYFILDGFASGADPYGLKIGGPKHGEFIGQSFTFPTSDNFEARGIEILNAQVGFFAAPLNTSKTFMNIKIHDCFIHDLNNPTEQGRAECFYIGNTSIATRKNGNGFDNVEIYKNLLQGLSGDGIQVALTKNLWVHDNVIDGYGGANLEQQRSGIILGGCTSGIVENNTISKGTGAGVQCFGGGEVIIRKNQLNNVATSATEDGIYIGGKCADETLTVRLIENTITGKPARDFVRDVTRSIVERRGNIFDGVADPIIVPVPPSTPPKTKVATFVTTLNQYSDGSFDSSTTKTL